VRVALQVVASVALATASTGCATVPACPAKGGPAWLELTSTHFHVRTDLDPADAAEAVRTFEEIRAAMLATVWPGAPDPPNRTEVIALRSHNELVAFVQVSNVFGVHTTQAPFAPVIVTGGDLQGRERDFLAHELAHELSDWFLPTRPRWYAEGIATFLETARYDRARQNAMVGKPSEIRLLDLRARRTLSAAKLLSRRDPSDVDMAQFEAAAWLLVHYLIDKRPRQFAELQLRFGLLEPADRAWSAALPDLPIDRVDGELWRYRSLGRYLGGERMVPVPAPAIRSRTMTDAEVHAARAFLYIATNLHGDMPKEDVQSETREAVDADAAVVDALAIQFFWLDRPEERAARSALARLGDGGGRGGRRRRQADRVDQGDRDRAQRGGGAGAASRDGCAHGAVGGRRHAVTEGDAPRGARLRADVRTHPEPRSRRTLRRRGAAVVAARVGTGRLCGGQGARRVDRAREGVRDRGRPAPGQRSGSAEPVTGDQAGVTPARAFGPPS
jgi:hypothetical protein